MIKILAFTDSHGDMRAAEEIVSLAQKENPDIVICSGDFSYFGMQHEKFLARLMELKKTIWFVPGNHESMEFSKEVETWYPFMKDVSYRTVEVSGVRIAGIPGTNEFWPGQSEEDEAYDTAIQLCDSLDRSKPLVFLTHFPPRGTAVDGTTHPTPDSGGSRVVKGIVEAIKPVLVLCGHYHQDFGKVDQLGPTRLINPGPHGLIITLDEDGLKEMAPRQGIKPTSYGDSVE